MILWVIIILVMVMTILLAIPIDEKDEKARKEPYGVQCATTDSMKYVSTWIRGDNPYDTVTDKLFLTDFTLKECFGWDLTGDYHVALLHPSNGGQLYYAYSDTLKQMCPLTANYTLGACTSYVISPAVDASGNTHNQLTFGTERFTQLVVSPPPPSSSSE